MIFFKKRKTKKINEMQIYLIKHELNWFHKTLNKAIDIHIKYKDILNLNWGDSIINGLLDYAEKKLKQEYINNEK